MYKTCFLVKGEHSLHTQRHTHTHTHTQLLFTCYISHIHTTMCPNSEFGYF